MADNRNGGRLTRVRVDGGPGQPGLELEGDLRDPDFRKEMGDAFLLCGNVSQAIEQYRHAVQLDPNTARRHNDLADAYSLAGMPRRALSEYGKALRLGGDAETFVGLGDLARQLRKTHVAVKEYWRAVNRNPHRAYYRYKLAMALFVTGDLDGARVQLEAAVDLAPKDAYYHFVLADFHQQGGAIDRAADHFELAVENAPLNEYYLVRLAAAYMSMGKAESAVSVLERAVKLRPRSGPYRVMLGQACLRAGWVDRAQTEIRSAPRLDAYDLDFIRRLNEFASEARPSHRAPA